MLKDASAYSVPGIRDDRGAEWVHRRMGSQSKGSLMAGVAPSGTIPVYVNHGRWVVDCPDCNGAQLACRTDRRFMCDECGNITIGGLWRPVDWPADIAAIEAVLQVRPLANQNWAPGETVQDLAADNNLRGI